MFTAPDFDPWGVTYTAIGAAIFWGKWSEFGRKELRTFIFADIVDLLPIPNATVRNAIECTLFIAIGVFVGMGVTEPSNVPQAITAGMSWTGFFAHIPKKKR